MIYHFYWAYLIKNRRQKCNLITKILLPKTVNILSSKFFKITSFYTCCIKIRVSSVLKLIFTALYNLFKTSIRHYFVPRDFCIFYIFLKILSIYDSVDYEHVTSNRRCWLKGGFHLVGSKSYTIFSNFPREKLKT